ncbi:protein downstream neighbor of son homolog isoform X2 [Drosophila tropicalis]|uniref:protein downstream neighbor of son homolog isoform X2 n=1 Tax=Drosophila tropicalis TaxID=46794 RepID=UPI0035AB8A82
MATDAAKKIKVNAEDEESGTPKANSATTASSSSLLCFVEETPTRPPPAKLALQKFDPIAFAKLLKQSNALAEEEDDMALAAQQKHTKHLPMDWCLKTRVRFFCPTELPSIQLKTSQMASGLTSFVRCIDTQQTEETTLDISDATRFNQCTYYWQHPHMPWVTLYPRNAKENVTQKLGERERKALSEEWNFSFRGLFQLLRARQCPYFYLCANTFTVLFRAAGIGGRAESHALVTPSTRGMRLALSQEGIEYSLPLKLNVDADEEEHREKAEVDVEKKHFDNDDDEEWLENLGVDEHELRRIQSSHARKVQATEMRDDFSDSSIIFIEGVECQGFFSYLLNSKSLISQVGRLAGIPPTLLSPIAFPKATMQHLVPCSKKVRLDGVDYFSIDIKGLLLPTFLPSVFDILRETREMFSCTLASSNNTFAFTKATQKLMESSSPPEKSHQMDKSNGEAVFNQQNLSECGLLPAVVKSICRSGSQAVGLLERVCYQRDQGFAWS